MTLDGLAAKSNVSRSMLSLVRARREQPDRSRAQRIGDPGLGVDALAAWSTTPGAGGDFFSAAPTARPARPAIRNRRLLEHLAGQHASPAQIVEVLLPAGTRVAYESGARDVNLHQQLWIQKGSIEVTVGTVTYRLGKDDCLAMQLNEPITFRNRTRRAARYMVVLASERRAREEMSDVERDRRSQSAEIESTSCRRSATC